MDSQRHVVRRLEPAEHLDFDEQLWPVNLALMLAAGCVAGMIWAICDFQTPVWYESGYFWMAVLLGSVLGLGGLAVYLGGKTARRLQMAAFLSLALHGVGLGALSMQRELHEPDVGPKNIAKHELRAIDILPDYHLTRLLPNRPQEEIEKPVETKIPDAALQAMPVKPREQAANLGAVAPRDEVAILDSTPKLVAPPVERKTIEPAAPRRGDAEAKLAKQKSPDAAAPAAGPVKAIDLSVPTTKVGPLEARSMPLGHQTTDPAAPRSHDDSALAMLSGLMQPGGPRSAPAPRTNDQPSPLVAAGPTLVKAVTDPGPVPRGEAPSPASAAKAAIPDLSQLRPATGVGRQASAGVVAGKTGSEMASIAPVASPIAALPSRLPIAKTSSEPSPTGGPEPRLMPRAAGSTARPIAELPAPLGQTASRVADGGPGPGPLTPNAIQVARGSPAASAPARSVAPPLNGPAGAGGFGVTLAMAGPQPGRAQLAAGPNPDPSLPRGGPVGRGKPGFAGIGTGAAALPAAGLPAAGPPGGIQGTPGTAAAADGPANGPARVGIARASGGKVGPGKGEGFDAGVADSSLTASVASAIGSNLGIGPNRGGAGRGEANEQPVVGLGTSGQLLPRSIGGNNGTSGTASVAGGDFASGAALPGGSGNGGPGGSGGDGIGPGGPVADSRATGAVRTSAGAGIPGGATVAGGSGGGDGPGGDGGGGGNGQIGAAQIGRPGAGNEDLPGGIVGGVPGGLGSGIGRAGPPSPGGLAGDVVGDQSQLAGGSPTGGNNRGSGKGGDGPGGDGPNGPGGAIDGTPGGLGRQAAGGVGSGGGDTGDGDGTGEGGNRVAGFVGGAQIGGPGSGEGSPGLSGNGEGGPAAIGGGLGARLPKSNAIGTPGGEAAQGGGPQFAGSPSTFGPGNNVSGSSGGPGGDGPGGPGGSGPGGDGSGRRFGNAGLPVPSDAIGSTEGSAGGGVPRFGLPDRRALPESDQLAISSGRFLQRQAGGGGPEVAADAPVRAPTPSFSGRSREGRGPGGTGDRDSEGRTEQAIESGLSYLANMQAADGSWSLHRFPGATAADVGIYRSDTAATGLSLLAFLGAGYDHYDDKYRETVRRGLEYLLRNQKPTGDLFLPMDHQFKSDEVDVNSVARLYSHSIATLAVCEALGMTGDKRLREPAQRAVNFLLAAQARNGGGWRYKPGNGGDTSVTGWAVTALKSAELAGLEVPSGAYENASRFLDTAQQSPSDGSRYLYNPEDRQAQLPSDNQRPTMTAVALLARIYTGWKHDDPNLVRGGEFIRAHPPGQSDKYVRDTYYWYYATQVMFQLGGENWKYWNDRLHPILIKSQVARGPLAGSWDPKYPVPDRWGEVCGRIYVTAMNLLSLEVYYRHLPIYEIPAAK
jgi:hypothetical protein